MITRKNVDQGYDTLRTLWDVTKKKNGTADCLPNVSFGFWHAGNTLDTFMDYLGRAQPDGYLEKAAELARQSVEVFEEVVSVDPTRCPLDQKPPTVAWWDDYGWWGIAFLKVHALTGQGQYLHGAQVCWSFMEQGGRHYADPSPPQSEKGGTWNHPPADGGVQNVITNALFLNLSAQLYQRTSKPCYLEGAGEQYKWFVYQFEHEDARFPVQPYGVLVNQLPYDPENGLWTGDQGVLLGGLMSFHAIISAAGSAGGPAGDPELAAAVNLYAWQIARAVMTSDQMVWLLPGPMYPILHETTDEDGWRRDLNGAVGKGVLIRYLAAFLEYQGDPGRAGFISQNANAVNVRTDDGYFPMSWVGIPKSRSLVMVQTVPSSAI